MQPSASLIALALLLGPLPAHALQNWELCLDKADFSFDEDASILAGSTTNASKKGCAMTFSVSGGKGEKYSINLCDPVIHIQAYPSLDSAPRRLEAGSAACPAPLFGADFDENAKEIQEFKTARDRIFELFAKIKAAYGRGSDKVDLGKPNSFSPEFSAGKIACGQFLLREYLNKCFSFEGKPAETPKSAPAPSIPGVLPQTIKR